MGRESLAISDPAILDALVDSVLHGLTFKDAAEKEGITDRVIRKWMKRGRDEDNRLQDNPKARPYKKEALYRAFYLKMEKAKAAAKGKVMRGWYKSATETAVIRETTIFQVLDPRTKQVTQESVKTTEKEIPPDWRAQQALMNNRYGMIPTSRVMFNLEEMTDEELERVANGEDPFDVLQERLSHSGERAS